MERVDERVEDQAPAAPRSYSCPECRQDFPSPEDLGVHLERHAPADVQPAMSPRGGMLTTPCPKGCGRNFKRKRTEDGSDIKALKYHAMNCDGSPPIVGAAAARPETGKPQKEDQVANLKCKKCGRAFTHPAWLDKHAKLCDGKTDAPSPRAAALAKRLKAERQPAPEVSEKKDEVVPLIVIPKDQSLPIRDRVINLLELEEDRLAKELGRCKGMLAAVRNAAPEEES